MGKISITGRWLTVILCCVNGCIKHAEEVEEGTSLSLHRTVALSCLFIYVVVSVLIKGEREEPVSNPE